MIAGVMLLLQAQWAVEPSTVRVGDTVRVERAVSVAAGVEADPMPLDASATVEPLGDPRAMVEEGRLRLWYRMALFTVGRQAIPMPDIELHHPNGDVSMVVGDTAWVDVASVLPAGDTLPEPKPSLGPLARPPVSRFPAVLLVGAVVALTLGWGVVRRRVRPRPARDWIAADSTDPPVSRWMGAGELRAVASTATDRLRARIAEQVPAAGRYLDTEACVAVLERERPEWPLRELSGVLQALERARFAPAVPGDVVVLVDDAESMIATLGGPRS